MPASHTSAAMFAVPIIVRQYQLPPLTYTALTPLLGLKDAIQGGNGRVWGTTKVKGVPDYAVRRRVRLIEERSGQVVRETWSDATTGAYSFDNIAATTTYSVVTYDHLHNFRAVIADNITPDPMP